MPAQTHKGVIASSLEGRAVTSFITILILINAVTLGLETDAEILSDFGAALHWIDRIILVIFSVELALKFYLYRLEYFRSCDCRHCLVANQRCAHRVA
jgi:hypothetical protein